MAVLALPEIRVAESMRSAAHESRKCLWQFMSLWSAFNNCYTTLYERDNGPTFEFVPDRIRKDGELEIPTPKPKARESDQLLYVVERLLEERALLTEMALMPETEFFLNRTPRWHGEEIPVDAKGQVLNGVLNVGRTTCREHPVWSPLARGWCEEVRDHGTDDAAYCEFARQIVFLLYTVRNNLMHGGKNVDDRYDRRVVAKAVPLLEALLEWLMGPERPRRPEAPRLMQV